MGRGFTIIELLIVIILLGILTFAVIGAVDPAEQAKKQRDDRYENASRMALTALDAFVQKNQKFPWQNEFGSAVAWTSLNSPTIGICSVDDKKNTNCTVAGEVATVGGLPTEIRLSDFMTTQDPTKRIYVGKGSRPTDALYACFIPVSRTRQLNWVDLKNFTPGETMPEDGNPKECASEPNWQTSLCYVCFASQANK